jgi:hypothetical protein
MSESSLGVPFSISASGGLASQVGGANVIAASEVGTESRSRGTSTFNRSRMWQPGAEWPNCTLQHAPTLPWTHSLLAKSKVERMDAEVTNARIVVTSD